MKQHFLTILGLLLLTACLVEQPDENFNTINPKVNPDYISTLEYSYSGQSFFPANDTIWVYNFAYLGFRSGDLYDYQLRLGSQIIRPFSGSTESFIIESNSHSAGSYTLEVTQRTKSGTNSLADHANAEYAEHKRSYVVTFTDLMYTPVITSIENIDGTVRIKWPPFLRGNFGGFTILKFKAGDFSAYQSMHVNDPVATYLDDTTYVGGVIQYQLQISEGGNVSSSARKEFSVPYNPKFMLTAPVPGTLRLTWNEFNFSNNIDHYALYIGNNPVAIADNISPSANSVDFTGTMSYGATNLYSLSVISKAGTQQNRYSYSDMLALGEHIPHFREIKYNKAENVYYMTSEPTVTTGILGYYKLDHNFNTLDSVVWPFDMYEITVPHTLYVSPNGQHLYVLKNFVVERRNVNNFADKTTYSLPALGLPNQYYDPFVGNENFAVTNNNLILLRLDNGSGYTAYVVDMNTQQNIFSLVVNFSGTHLSGDGKYFVKNNEVYKFTGTTYDADFLLPYANIKYIQFMNDDPNELVVLTNNKAIRYNCDTRTEIAAWDCAPHNTPYSHLDQASKKLVYSTTTTRMTLDLQTGASRSVPGNYTIENDILFHGRGFALRNY